jgi:hypothetical protein
MEFEFDHQFAREMKKWYRFLRISQYGAPFAVLYSTHGLVVS